MSHARRGGLLLVPVLFAALLSGPAAAAPDRFSPRGSCSAAVLVLDSLHIEAAPSKKQVRPGETFTVDFTVTRPAHRDPLDQGIEWGEPPASFPAKDVIVGLSVYVGDRTYFWNIGLTDADGKETLKLRVPGDSEHGWAYAVASGRHWIKRDCPDILEESFRFFPKFVKVDP